MAAAGQKQGMPALNLSQVKGDNRRGSRNHEEEKVMKSADAVSISNSSHSSIERARKGNKKVTLEEFKKQLKVDTKFDASKGLEYAERRRGSVVESRTNANKELINFS